MPQEREHDRALALLIVVPEFAMGRTGKGFLSSSVLSSRGGLEHGFGTRESQVPSGLVLLTQIHSADVVIIEGSGPTSDRRGDALVTKTPGIAIGIGTADCVPLLLYDPEKHVIGAVHAGWRGIVKGIVRQTLKTMEEAFGVSRRALVAGIGPAIGPCSYEVGEDVLRAFRDAFPWWKRIITDSDSRAKRHRRVPKKFMVDLPKSVALELEGLGLAPGSIDILRSCTFCSSLFHSYRRDGKECGRQVSFISLTSSPG